MPTTEDAVYVTLDDAQALILSGRQIAAIKLVRERFGVGLKQAKDLVDGLAAGRRAEIQMAFQLTGFRPPEPRELPESSEDEVRRLLAQGKKIAAIKLHREAFGASLADSKAAVESRTEGRFPQTTSPTSLVEEPQTLAQRLGVFGWLLVLGLGLLIMVGCAAVVVIALSQV